MWPKPPGWTVARLDDVATCLDFMRRPVNGSERDRRKEGKSPDELFPYYGATQQQGWIDDFLFDEELVLLGEDGVPFFEPNRTKAYRITGKSWVNNHAHVFRPRHVLAAYLIHYLNVFDYKGRVVGSTRSKLNQAKAVDIPVVVPPRDEQRRIIAKVDELMALCDRLDAARTEREIRRDRLVVATLNRLTTSATNSTEEARFSATFALSSLQHITFGRDHVSQIRGSILALAVQGRLVDQLFTDEPPRAPQLRSFAASSDFDRRAYEEELKQLTLPSTWISAPLALVSTHIVDCPHTTPKWTESGEVCIRTNQLKRAGLDLSASRFVSSDEYLERIERLKPQGGDILYSREGGILGIACIIPSGVRVCMGQRLMLIRAGQGLIPAFLNMVLNSPQLTSIAFRRTTGGAAPRVNMSTVRAYPIPLPPLAEQHRIIAKVNALMALCDQLEVSLATASTTRAKLLEATLRDALLPAEETLLEAAQ